MILLEMIYSTKQLISLTIQENRLDTIPILMYLFNHRSNSIQNEVEILKICYYKFFTYTSMNTELNLRLVFTNIVYSVNFTSKLITLKMNSAL